jgi:hypothetical protein
MVVTSRKNTADRLQTLVKRGNGKDNADDIRLGHWVVLENMANPPMKLRIVVKYMGASGDSIR